MGGRLPRPNLLVLMTDQQRADTVGPSSPCRTPNLDHLAARGTCFLRCYSTNPICSPSRASLMTGLLPHSHGMVDCTHTVEPYRADLKAGLPFWSRRLREAGYRTGYFGKWHIERSNRLEQFGFDSYELMESFEAAEVGCRRVPNAGFLECRRSLGLPESDRRWERRGMVRHRGYRDLLLHGVVDEPVEGTGEHYVFSRGIDFLTGSARQEQPWCLFLSTVGPHDPYVVPREYRRLYDARALTPPPSFQDDLAHRPGIYRRMQRVWDQMQWSDFAEATACYYAFCSLIDDQIGRVLRVLEETGQSENTLVLFLSDHGDYMGAHRLMLKGVPAFEEAYRVPLILKGPRVTSGQEVPEIVSLLDVAPTLMELTLGEGFSCHGRSLLPLLDGNGSNWDSEAYAEMQGQRMAYTQRVLWRDSHKYVFNAFDEDELYDLAQDPHELRNLAGSRESVCREMAARMWEIARATGDYNLYESQYGTFRWAPVGPELGC